MLLTATALGLFPVPLPEKGTAGAEDKSRRESHPSTAALSVTPLIHIQMGFGGVRKNLAQIPFGIASTNNKNLI